ncbi:MAG TPA: J domain-containing protein [Candidatus Eisenbergiella merdipullorum]|uniref:J domain-containing protein n=1 Tax=Candidatus Eisenbergiella merdipullorum TaxID=2838553 RepID=A0A9D2I5L5_9FIRM|nr:J domain-containing protein [Candidatus Eisenbergiella merdipullorum]
MTEQEAYRILGISPGADEADIKRRYRKLMMRAHPDAGLENPIDDARKINAAYTLLKKRTPQGGPGSAGRTSGGRQDRQEEKSSAWDAPVNIHAYTERDILHYAEDREGTVLGSFCIARGKYLWKTQEDFPLFLLSIYRCSSQILDEADGILKRADAPAIRPRIQAELSYLLAQQFIDGTSLLKELAHQEMTDASGQPVFRVSAMLESGKTVSGPQLHTPPALCPGETLCPSALRQHRLYLKDRSGREVGYLSFPDDRLYYTIIPLFEQRRARVRIRVSSKQPSGSRYARCYQNLDLWLKLSQEKLSGPPESLNLQIERLLERYRRG